MSCGVTPSGLGSTSTRAPKASIVRRFSSANASDVTMCSGWPVTAQTKARELPVLPPVYSTTGWPGARRPARSAPSIMASAMRSLYDPVGLAASSFTHTSAMPGSTRWTSRTTGVFPMAPNMPSLMSGRPYRRTDAGLARFLPPPYYLTVVDYWPAELGRAL